MRYALLGMQERTTADTGALFPVGGRTRWKAQLDVARVAGGSPSVTVVVEVSPTGADGSWATVCTLGPATTVGTTEKRTWNAGEWAATPSHRDVWMRARVTGLAGTVTFGLSVDTLWLDPESLTDAALLSQELRSYPDVERVCAQAEADVLRLVTRTLYRGDPWAVDDGAGYRELAPDALTAPGIERTDRWAGWPTGTALDAEFTDLGMQDAMRREVARQAEWLFRREMLSRRTTDVEAVAEARRMGVYAPNLSDGLAPYRPKHRTVWRGRG